jgi:FMN phosphatase YigB (HAD superfamily)
MSICQEPAYVLCFDLDDTLIETRYKYNLAMHRCAARLIEAVGNYAPYGVNLVQAFLNLDDDFIKVMGYDAQRFPIAWVAFYREICSKYDLPVDEAVLLELVEIARTFREEPFRLVPGAKELLYEMRREGLEAGAERTFYLITIGDVELQQRKLETTGLWEFFGKGEHVFIVPTNKAKLLTQIKNQFEGLPVFMVGDSLRNDVAAAHDAGVTSVRIPTPGHWHHDDSEHDADVTLARLGDLPDALRAFCNK